MPRASKPTRTTPPPRRPRAARLSREDRAQTLRAAALRMLAEHGIGHTNHSLVGEAAGVSAQTVFFYYRTHAALTALVLDEVAARILDEIVRPGIALADGPRAAIEWMLLRFGLFIDTARDPARVWLDWSTAIRSETWPRYLEFLDEARRLVTEMLVRARDDGAIAATIDCGEAGELVIGLAHMVGHMKFTGVHGAVIERTVHGVVASYLDFRA